MSASDARSGSAEHDPLSGAPGDRSLAFVRTIARWRYAIVLGWLAIIVVGFAGAERIVYDGDVLVYFDKANPERQALDAIEARFGRSQEVANVLVPRGPGGAATPDGLRLMAALAEAAAARPEVSAVRSPLSLIELTPAAVHAASEAELAAHADRLRERAQAGDRTTAALIAPDASIAAVAAIVDAVADNEIVAEIADAHAVLRDEVAAPFDGFEVLQTGRIPIDAAFLRESRDDVDAYSGLQLAILLAILLLALGSVSLTGAVFLIVIGIVGGTAGAIGWSGFALNGISSAAPAVLMGLTVASAIHVVIAWQNALRQGRTRQDALALAYARNTRPIILSTVTTMISFLILNTAEAPPFRDLGNLVALGLVFILAAVFTVLPALLLIIPASTAHHRRIFEGAMGTLGVAALRGRKIVLATMAGTAALAALGILAIEIDDTFSHYFDERYEVRRATDLFENALSGTTIIDVAIDTGRDGGAFAEATITRATELDGWLLGRPEVARLDSLAGLGAAANRGAPTEAGDEGALRRTMAAMVREGVPNLIDDTGRWIRFAVVMRGVSSKDTLAFADDARAVASTLFQTEDVAVTGMPVLSAQLSLGSARAMIIGMVLALVAISTLLMVTLRDLRLGLISLMPNVLPVAIAFGLWGALVGEVSFAATVVGALTYGIVVDDTVHLLAKYQWYRARLALDDAVRAAFRSVGVAVVVTTVALAGSFLPFALSGFLVNHQFGALTALTLAAALVADVLFLPALLSVGDRDGRGPRLTRRRRMWPPRRQTSPTATAADA